MHLESPFKNNLLQFCMKQLTTLISPPQTVTIFPLESHFLERVYRDVNYVYVIGQIRPQSGEDAASTVPFWWTKGQREFLEFTEFCS